MFPFGVDATVVKSAHSTQYNKYKCTAERAAVTARDLHFRDKIYVRGLLS